MLQHEGVGVAGRRLRAGCGRAEAEGGGGGKEAGGGGEEGFGGGAERALKADPLLDGVDQILAVADVLLASQRRVNNQLDWYAVLQIPHPTFSADAGGAAGGGDGVDPVAVKRHYRRLSLLHPERNRYPGADSAFRYARRLRRPLRPLQEGPLR